jgi:hypothetical protein
MVDHGVEMVNRQLAVEDTLNRYNDALKTVAAKYYHRLELVDDFNHLDDTIPRRR